MQNNLANLLSDIGFQLPLLVVYLAGIWMAISRRAEAPYTANRVLLALVLLLVDALVLSQLNRWFANSLAAREGALQSVYFVLSLLGLARNLLHAIAFAILLSGIFPAASQTILQAAWLRYTGGGLLGLLIGVGVAIALANPMVEAFQISNFEGGQGYFVVFFLIPLFAVLGILLGLLVVYMFRRPA